MLNPSNRDSVDPVIGSLTRGSRETYKALAYPVFHDHFASLPNFFVACYRIPHHLPATDTCGLIRQDKQEPNAARHHVSRGDCPHSSTTTISASNSTIRTFNNNRTLQDVHQRPTNNRRYHQSLFFTAFSKQAHLGHNRTRGLRKDFSCRTSALHIIFTISRGRHGKFIRRAIRSEEYSLLTLGVMFTVPHTIQRPKNGRRPPSDRRRPLGLARNSPRRITQNPPTTSGIFRSNRNL